MDINEKIKQLPEDLRDAIKETKAKLREAANLDDRLAKLTAIGDSDWEAAQDGDNL